jgi:hypothetical protein
MGDSREGVRRNTLTVSSQDGGRQSIASSGFDLSDRTISCLRNGNYTPSEVYAMALSHFEDPQYLEVICDPERGQGGLWKVLPDNITSGNYGDEESINPLIFAFAFDSKTQFVKGPLWLSGLESFARGILLLSQAFPRKVTSQSKSQAVTAQSVDGQTATQGEAVYTPVVKI